MPNEKQDMLKVPIEIAQQRFQEQLSLFQQQFTQGDRSNPVQDWLKENNIRLKDLRLG